MIGREAREQMLEAEGRLPDLIVAAVGGGAECHRHVLPGLDAAIRLDGRHQRAGGTRRMATSTSPRCPPARRASCTAASATSCRTGDGRTPEGHSISAGLDYPGIGPEHSWLADIGRVEYVPIMDHEALEAFQVLTRLEGIIPALEPSHAIAEVIKRAPKMGKDEIILMNLSGRGDKDIFTVGKYWVWGCKSMTARMDKRFANLRARPPGARHLFRGWRPGFRDVAGDHEGAAFGWDPTS